MLAIIKEKDAEYVSPVFAIRQAGWNTEVLAFDSLRTHIVKIKMWRPRRRVFIVQWQEFAHKRGAWQGCSTAIENDGLWKALRFRRQVALADFPEFGKYAEEISLPDWFEVKDADGIESLMNVALDFHDSILVRADESQGNTEIEFDTTWDCIITVKFQGVRKKELIDRIGLIYDSVLEKTDGGYKWRVTDFEPGTVGGIIGPLPVSGEPYIDCANISWQIKLGRSEFHSKTREYSGIIEFYSDLKDTSENVFFEDGKLILKHKDDTLVIEQGPKGYVSYRNGRRERVKWEEQDIFEYASYFLTQVNPEDIEDEILADVPAAKPLYVWHYVRYTIALMALWLALGLLLGFFAGVPWVICAAIFIIPAAISVIGVFISSARQNGRRYIVTSARIYCFCEDVLIKFFDVENVKNAKLFRSFFVKGAGNIKIKGGRYYPALKLVAVSDVQKVYDAINKVCRL